MIDKLLDFNRSLTEFVVGSEGNASLRESDRFYIKASGVSMRDTMKHQVFVCDLWGTPLEHREGKPSMEIGFHSWIYRNLEVSAIAHTHPTNTMKILCSDIVSDFASNRLFPDQVVFNGSRACIVEYAQPGKELEYNISLAIENYLKAHSQTPRLILLKNHGIITLGSSEKECVISTQICEKASEIFIGSFLLGKTVFLDQTKIIELENNTDEIYRRNQR